jgi:hypothetical protein
MLLSFSAFFFLGKNISTVQGAAHCYIYWLVFPVISNSPLLINTCLVALEPFRGSAITINEIYRVKRKKQDLASPKLLLKERKGSINNVAILFLLSRRTHGTNWTEVNKTDNSIQL